MALTKLTATFVMIMVVLTTVSSLNFTEIPESVTVPIGSTIIASFFCQHTMADSIVWLVNGTSIYHSGPHDQGVTVCTVPLPDRETINRLKIEIRPEYNETVVVCVAVLNGGLERTAPAELIIEDISDNTSFKIPEGFNEFPLSLNVSLGERAMFNCQHCTATTINWRLNGTRVHRHDIPDGILLTYILPENYLCGILYTLIVVDVMKYNSTLIQCEANLDSNSNENSQSALLLTQGQLGGVTNLSREATNSLDSLLYTWQPPDTLNLTYIEPDIAYCVLIYNVTCPEPAKRINQVDTCTVTETYFRLQKNFGGDDIYEIQVTPTINLLDDFEGSNGTSSFYRDMFVSFDESAVTYTISIQEHPHVEVQVTLNLQGIDPLSVIPGTLSIHLKPIDYSDEESEVCATQLSETGAQLQYARFSLNCSTPFKVKRLYLSTIIAACNTSTTDPLPLSTHLIQNIKVESVSSSNDEIIVSGDIIMVDMPNVSVTGFLAIALADIDSAIHSGIAILNDNLTHAEVILSGLLPEYLNDYRVSVFDIQENGLPFNRSASVPQKIKGTYNQSNKSHSQTSTLQHNFTASYENGCFECSVSNSSALSNSSACVVVVFNKSHVKQEFGLMNIEVYHFEQRDLKARGCINENMIFGLSVLAFIYDENIESIGGQEVQIEPPSVQTTDEQQPSLYDSEAISVTAVFLVVFGIAMTLICVLFIIILFYTNKKQSRSQVLPGSVSDTVLSIVNLAIEMHDQKINKEHKEEESAANDQSQ